MRIVFWMLSVLGLLGPTLMGQPQAGDLIVTVIVGNNGGAALRLDTSSGSTVKVTTLASYAGRSCRCRMAEDNKHFLVALSQAGQAVVQTDPSTGRSTTLASFPGFCCGLDLDCNSVWLTAGVDGSASPLETVLWKITSLSVVSTIAKFPIKSGGYFSAISVDPDRKTGGRYVLALEQGGTARVVVADNNGVATTLVGSRTIPKAWDMIVDPFTGKYLVCAYTGGLKLVSKSGSSITTVTASIPAIATATCVQDGSIWIAGQGASAAVHQLGRDGVSRQTIPIRHAALGILSYGSRQLVCLGNAAPGSRGLVRIQSQDTAAANKDYWLAASLARRPMGNPRFLEFGNGEYLILDHTDALFWISVLGLAPSIFSGFKGTLDSKGQGIAQVDFPKQLKPNLGIPVFVAGIIYDSKNKNQVIEVTNTHWFML